MPPKTADFGGFGLVRPTFLFGSVIPTMPEQPFSAGQPHPYSHRPSRVEGGAGARLPDSTCRLHIDDGKSWSLANRRLIGTRAEFPNFPKRRNRKTSEPGVRRAGHGATHLAPRTTDGGNKDEAAHH